LAGYRWETRDGREIAIHNHKGHGEQSLYLPIPVQVAMSEAGALKIGDAELCFYGTADGWDQPSAYSREVSGSPTRLRGNFYSRGGSEPIPPSEMRFDCADEEPDLRACSMRWRIETRLYGHVRCFAYPSKDRSLIYIFNVDGRRRMWLGGVQNDSAVGESGVRRNWIDAGLLCTPAYEYPIQAARLSSRFALSKGTYVDVYGEYLQHIPLFAELASKIAE
jgi:hypothetical protein